MQTLFRPIFKVFFNHAPLLLTLSMLLWAGNITLGRAMRDAIPPVTLSYGRWLIALLIALLFGWQYLKKDWPVIRQNLPILFFLSAMGVGAYNTLYYTGLHSAPVAHGVLINANGPLLILVMGWLFFRDRTTFLSWVGVLFGVLGVILVVVQPDTEFSGFGIGEAYMIAAMLCYSAYTIYLRKRPSIAPLSFIIVTFFGGIICLTPFLIYEWSLGVSMVVDWPVIATFGYVGIFPSLIAYLCFNRGIELLGAIRASTYFYLIPVFGACMAWFFLEESISFQDLMGFLCVISGLFLAERSRYKSVGKSSAMD